MTEPVTKRPRGRPPSYDRDTALGQAGDVFWHNGYAATTLDDLSAATGMNRPSLSAAFGDKHAIYLATLARYAKASQDKLDQALAIEQPLAAQLFAIYDGAIGIYLSGVAARGCFLVGTAVSEASDDGTIRERLLAALQAMDRTYEARFERARATGELDGDADPRALAQVASAVLNALAVRARAGESRESLRRTARQAVSSLVATKAPSVGSRRSR